jgi:hypothetical protein
MRWIRTYNNGNAQVEMRVEIGPAIPLLVECLADFHSETRTTAASVLAKLSENGALHLGFTV